MSKLRKNVFVFFMLVMVFMFTFCTGCNDSPEQKAVNEANIERAKTNAINYVQEKYSVQAEVVETILEREQGLFTTTPTSWVLVRMKHKGKAFNVYINGGNSNTEGYDNYQEELIEDAVKDIVNKSVPGVESVYILGGKGREITYDKIAPYRDNLYSTYFTGDNLKEVIEPYDCYTCAMYVNKDLSDVSNGDFLELLNIGDMKLCMVSLRDASYIDRLSGLFDYEKNAVYMSEYCEMKGKSKKDYQTFELKQYDDFYYYVEGADLEDVEVKDVLKSIEVSNWNGKNIQYSKTITPAYSINAKKKCVVHIYYPIIKMNVYDEKLTKCATYKYKSNKDNYSTLSTDSAIVNNEYIYFATTPAIGDKEEFYFTYINKVKD